MKLTTRLVHGPTEKLFGEKVPAWFPPYEEIHAAVVDYQSSAIRRKDFKWALTDLQIHLAQSIHVEAINVKQLATTSFPEEFGRARELIHGQSELHLNALYKVADGMAFRFLDYNMPLYQALSHNQTSTVDLADAGHLHEIELAALFTDHMSPDTQVLLCGLNEVTNIGDVILKTKTNFEVIEVKKGEATRGSRIRRQLKRMDNLRDFFETGETSYGAMDVKLRMFPPRKHRLTELQVALEKAADNGPQILDISDHQFVWCLNTLLLSPAEIRQAMNSLHKVASERFGPGGYEIFTSLAHRTRRAGPSIPTTAYPLSPDLIAHILLGGAVYVSVLSWEQLKQSISKFGWQVTDLADMPPDALAKIGYPVLFLSNPDVFEKNMMIPVDFVLSWLYELIDFDTFLDSLTKHHQELPEEGQSWIPMFQDDARLWR